MRHIIIIIIIIIINNNNILLASFSHQLSLLQWSLNDHECHPIFKILFGFLMILSNILGFSIVLI